VVERGELEGGDGGLRGLRIPPENLEMIEEAGLRARFFFALTNSLGSNQN
jgi:hypothetical protein